MLAETKVTTESNIRSGKKRIVIRLIRESRADDFICEKYHKHSVSIHDTIEICEHYAIPF